MVRAAGVRIGWRDLPSGVQERVEAIVGGPVAEAVSQPGGFSPGTADRVRTANGRRAFVKAVTPVINPRSADLARQELTITAALPAHAPVPRMLGGFDDGDWVVLVLEDIEGTHPRTPWEAQEIDVAVTTLRELAAALTPAPPIDVPSAADSLAGDFASWDRLAGDPPADLDPWTAAHLPDLVAATATGLASVATGNTLTHCDIRADNILVRPDGRMIIVDWPWACVGPPWLDAVLLGIEVLARGGAVLYALWGTGDEAEA